MDGFSITYDILNAIISIADLITDILVTYRFYIEKRQSFFISACTIIGITHLCYSLCFAARFTKSTWRCKRIITFLFVVPISPLLPFIFYWASFPSNSFSKLLTYIGLDTDEVTLNNYKNASGYQPSLHEQPLLQNVSMSASHSHTSIHEYNQKITNANRKAKYQRMNAWFQTRILFNCGFLIEGVMQSFPQAILQCVAMMYYGEDDNYLAVTSIILSLLSIAIKSIVIFLDSYCTLMIIHKWVCTMTDFLGIFVIISLAFSHVNNITNINYCVWFCELLQINGISWLGYLWLYKVLFITFPLVFLLVLGLILFYVHSFWEENNCNKISIPWQCCTFFPSLLIFIILWIPGVIGVICGVVGFEVLLYCWSLCLCHQLNHDRFATDYNHPDSWHLLIKFLLNNDESDKQFKSLLMNYNQNTNDIQILKMYSINYVLSGTKSYYSAARNDEVLYQFLDEREWSVFGCNQMQSNSKQNDNGSIIKLKHFYEHSVKYNPNKHSEIKSFICDMCSIYPEIMERKAVHFYVGIPAVFIFTFTVWIFAPLYVTVNRILSFIYPFIALLWLLYPKYDSDMWFQFDFNQSMQTQNVTIFQYCITTVFIIFDIICIYLTIKLIIFERLLSFILPGNDYINIYSRTKSNVSVYDQVIDFYEFHKYNMLTNHYLIKTYGDIAFIIILYLPRSFKEYTLYLDMTD